MAKSLVRNRHAVTKMYGLKSQLQAISLRIAVSKQPPCLPALSAPQCGWSTDERSVWRPGTVWSDPEPVLTVRADTEVHTSYGRRDAWRHQGEAVPRCAITEHLCQQYHLAEHSPADSALGLTTVCRRCG